MLLPSLLLLTVPSLLPALAIRCSALVPSHQSSRSLEVRMPPGSSLCLLRGERLAMVLTVVRITVRHQVSQLYSYTWPQVQVSCYCTCGPAQCQLPQCRLCYNMTRLSTPCSSSTSSSSTCCSIRLSHPNHHLTALRLGHSSLQVQYKLQTLSDTGTVVETRVNKVEVGHGSTTVHHEMGDLMLQLSRLPAEPVDEWLVASTDGLRRGRVNLPQDRNSKVAGWLRVEGGSVQPPSMQLISTGVHITTKDCRHQAFSADLTGLNLSPGTLGDRLDHLTWDGNRTVTDRNMHSVKIGLWVRSMGAGLVVYRNQSRLGTWGAVVTISRAVTALNITTRQSHGLIMGRIQTISFSFFLSSPAKSSINTVIPTMVAGMSQTVTVCLRVVTSRETCKDVRVVSRDLEDQSQKYSQTISDVQAIPVMWHSDSQPMTRSDSAARKVLHWLEVIFTSTDPIILFINCSVIFLIFIFLIRILTCFLPKCNK